MKNWIVSIYLILKYKSADLPFTSYRSFGRFSRFMERWFDWKFSYDVLLNDEEKIAFPLFYGAINEKEFNNHTKDR